MGKESSEKVTTCLVQDSPRVPSRESLVNNSSLFNLTGHLMSKTICQSIGNGWSLSLLGIMTEVKRGNKSQCTIICLFLGMFQRFFF